MHAGGKERRLVELLKYLKNRTNVQVQLALMSRDMRYPEVLELGIPITYFIRKGKNDPMVVFDFCKLCRAFRPDVIHTWDLMTSVYAIPASVFLRINLLSGMITNATGIRAGLNTEWMRWKIAFLFSDKIVGNSKAGLNAYDAPARKSVCVYNGFDGRRKENLEDPGTVRFHFGVESPLIVGMLGEFADRKDFVTYISAAQQVLATRRDVTFLCIGNGKNEERCRSLVDPKNAAHIKFLGWQAHVESIVNILDVGVLATNASVHGEGISNSILEYMALGKPAVATDSGGSNEIVEEGVTGFLVESGNIEQLAERIQRLLNDSALRSRMGGLGKERVSTTFSIERMASNYLELYHRLVQKEEAA